MHKLSKIIFLLIFIPAFFISCTTLRTVSLINSGESVFQDNTINNIPFILKGHAIIVRVYINDSQEKYNFILDTGAITAIDKRLAADLNLSNSLEIKAGDTGGGTQKVQFVKLNNIGLNNIRVNNCGSAILDLSKIGVHGLLGSNFLRHFKIIINYRTQELIVSKDNKPDIIKNSDSKIKFTTDIKYGFAPKVKCIINNDKELDGIIDTGAPYIAGLPVPIIKNMKNFKAGKVLESKGSVAGGFFKYSDKSYLLIADTLKIGDMVVKELPVYSSDAPDLIIGKQFLSNFLVTLNYPAKEMILKPFENTRINPDIFSCGLALERKETGETIISGVWDKSPADQSDLKPGDEILTINSKDTAEFSLLELMSIFNNDNIKKIEITYLKDNVKKNVILTKVNLLNLIPE